MATQRNYAQQMDAVLAGLGGTRPRLLLHACCGPCSSAVLEQLCRYFEITVLYYNPNTWPAAEYYRRGEELQKFVAAAHPLGVTVVEDTYDPQQFYTAVAGLENEPERGSQGPGGAEKSPGPRQPLHRLLPAADAPRGAVRAGQRL